MTMIIPFRLRGVDGTVTVEYAVNDDPRRWGYSLLGLPYAPDVARGFPVCQATAVFAAEGYGANMGWVQIVRYHVQTGDEHTVLVDVAPQLIEAQAAVPYMAWGPCPAFFDAPSITADVGDVDWGADAFLVASPDALMTPVVQPLCGFRWGYTTRAGKPTPTPLTPADAPVWDAARVILTERYPRWEFRSEWADESRG